MAHTEPSATPAGIAEMVHDVELGREKRALRRCVNTPEHDTEGLISDVLQVYFYPQRLPHHRGQL